MCLGFYENFERKMNLNYTPGVLFGGTFLLQTSTWGLIGWGDLPILNKRNDLTQTLNLP